ncbi:hypothetical protein [Nocardia niigatensis]
MGLHSPLNLSSQAVYPWRATARTTFQVAIALASLLPIIAVTGGIPTEGGVAVVLAVCAGTTRVMALPEVEAFLAKFAPWLLAEPNA